MHKFSIKIDDQKHSLDSERGISIDFLSEILKDLYRAIDMNEGARCTLSNIRGNCYAMDFSTDSAFQAERFQIVHKNIQDIPLKDLDDQQRKYAITLKKLTDQHYYINAYDENKNKIASISEVSTDKIIKYYFSQKTIYGFLSELGSKSLDTENKHIYIDGFPYKIFISKEKDLELKNYYRTEKLAIKLRVKHAFEKGNIINAEMISFKTVGNLKLSENLSKEGFISLNIVNDSSTLEGIIDSIYGNK